MALPTVLITGGSGLIGQALADRLLEEGYDIIILTRSPGRCKRAGNQRMQYAHWNIAEQEIDRGAVGRADVVVHLAGANVGEKRWTKKRKQEIISSRVKTSELLVHALKNIPNKIHTVISASATGYYGEHAATPGRALIETDPPSADFLSTSCRQWEQSIQPVISLGKRLVILRTGPVLSRKGGMLPPFIRPLRFGLATILGSGKQILSWIHIHDIVNMYIHAIGQPGVSGIYNAVSPKPVSNRDFVMELAKTRNGKWFIPVRVPSLVLKGLFGEMSTEVLKSTKVSAEKIMQSGFMFRYPGIGEALKDLSGKE